MMAYFGPDAKLQLRHEKDFSSQLLLQDDAARRLNLVPKSESWVPVGLQAISYSSIDWASRVLVSWRR